MMLKTNIEIHFFNVGPNTRLHLIKQDFLSQIQCSPIVISARGFCNVDRQLFTAVIIDSFIS